MIAALLARSLQAPGALAQNLQAGRWDVVLGRLRDLGTEIVGLLPLLLLALLVLLLFAWLARVVGRWQRPYRRMSPNAFVQDLVRHTARTAVLLVGVLLALEIVGATQVAAAVLGTAGVLGIAIGFAFKDLVENYIAGVLLSLRQPFEPNDHVVIDGHEGKVIRLTSRAAVLMTQDGNHLRIPNAQVFKGVILNYTRNPLRRFTFRIGVGSGEDLAAALALGVETLRSVPGVIPDPPPWGQIDDLGDSSVPLSYFGWLDQRASNFALVRSESLRRVKLALEGAGIDLPEPTYRLRMEETAPPDRAERPAREAASPARTATPPHPPDVGTADAIDRQIAEERAETPVEADLLRADAPKE